MGTDSDKFFDVKKTNDFFSDVYSEFETFNTYAQTHQTAISDFASTDQWKGIDAEAGKTLLSVDVSNLLTSILDAQDKIVDLQEGILTTFASDVDAATNAKIKVGTLETIKSDFGAFYSDLDYLALEAETCASYFQSDYGKYKTFSTVELSGARDNFKTFGGEDAEDENGFLYECIQKLLNFDANTLSYLQEQNLATIINDIGTSMGFTYENDFIGDILTTTYKQRVLGEIAGKDYYSSSSNGVSAEESESEPSWIETAGGWIIATVAGDLSHKTSYQHGKAIEDDDANGWFTKYLVETTGVSFGGFKYRHKFKKLSEKYSQKSKDLFSYHYVNDDDDGYIHKGKGKLGSDNNGHEYDHKDEKGYYYEDKNGKKHYISEEEKKRYNKDKFDKELYRVAEIGVDKSVEKSAVRGHYKKGDENTYIDVEAKVLNREIHGGVHAGMYRYETTASGETKKVFSPAVKAEVGASACAFEVNANGRIGNEVVGGYANGNLRGLSAEAAAGVTAKKGEVHASASAEADLFKASGSVGGEVCGAKVGVNGSVKVGIGAHADVGIKNGVVKCEIGAAIGLGVDVGFEVDAGGLINAASDACESAWDGVSNAAGDAKDWFDSLW